MEAGKRNQTFKQNGGGPYPPNQGTSVSCTRNLMKSHIGGVIFGCKNSTITECLSKQLFGLPAQHFSYVKNIDPGLPLFLFNYSDRKLHGIYESASFGRMNIDPYAWTTDGSDRTLFPAQVQICVRVQCKPLPEDQFKPIIKDNYYYRSNFWFELDHTQVSKLLLLLSSLAVGPRTFLPLKEKEDKTIQCLPSEKRVGHGGLQERASLSDPGNNCKTNENVITSAVSACIDCNTQSPDACFSDNVSEKDEKVQIYMKLKQLVRSRGCSDPHLMEHEEEIPIGDDVKLRQDDSLEVQTEEKSEKNKDSHMNPADPSIITQLLQEVNELKAFKLEHLRKMDSLECKLVQTETEIQQLKDRCMMLESFSESPTALADETIESLDEVYMDLHEAIFLVGGHDGILWLSTLDAYSPDLDVKKSLNPMNSTRAYASLAKLNEEFYVIGGGNGHSWYDSVESYKPADDQWTSHPSLNDKKGCLAATTLNDKLFAIGGGNGLESFATVEMFDICVGRWIVARSMLEKRFALAAAELNGAIYAVGGYDGNYLKSAERFDPREHSWNRIESMNTKRGCPSLAVLNEKIYALGGHDGNTMVQSVEVFDPRAGKWMIGEPMTQPRGYAACAVLKGSIYMIGGLKADEQMIVDSVECYEEGRGWREIQQTAIGRRCFSSAIVL